MKVGEIKEALQRGMKKTMVEAKEHILTEENLRLLSSSFSVERARLRG